MDGLRLVDEHVDRLLNKYAQYIDAYCTSLDSLNRQVETLHRELIADAEPESTLSVAAVLIFEQFLKRAREVLQQVCSNHREMHASVSKIGREIDKNFASNLEDVCMRKIKYECDPVLRPHTDLLITKHYLSLGIADIADEMLEHSGCSCKANNHTKFANMYVILNALKNKNIVPALEWVNANRETLAKSKSDLEFYLTRLEFIQLLQKGCDNREEIIQFARRFNRFANTNTKEMQELMTSLLFLTSGLESSPYNYLLSDKMWDQAVSSFTSDWCKVHKIPTASPLKVIMDIGMKAVVAMLNLRKVMGHGKVVEVLGLGDELPVEVDMGDIPQYHSVFACPILRQATSDENPPVRLACGHVISRDALSRLVSHDRLKCPYCPQESLASKAKVIYF
uniref:CTLH domain-containing protein n=1 Tax=Trichuris muris TaxID=70415 RepID=A0A5S6QXK9_TRIMR